MAGDDRRAASLAAWVGLFDALGEGRVPGEDEIARCAAADVYFRDPFNEVRGHAAMRRILAHTLEQVKDVHLTVQDTAWSDGAAYLKWEMGGTVKYLGGWSVTGMSEVTFDAAGLVQAHVDYWDAAGGLYARLPVVGRLCRWMLRMGRA